MIESESDTYRITRNGRTFEVVADQMLINEDMVTFLNDGMFQLAVRNPDWVTREHSTAHIGPSGLPRDALAKFQGRDDASWDVT